MDDRRRESEDYRVQRLFALAASYVDEDSTHMSRGVLLDAVEHAAIEPDASMAMPKIRTPGLDRAALVVAKG